MSIDTTTLLPEVSHVVEPPQRDATVMELAAVVAGSRDFPDCRTPEKAAVRILAGREMGVGPINSVIGIRVQNGRVSMDATLMAGAIKRSGRYDYRVTEHTNEACSLEFSENGQKVGDSAFTWEDAKKANLDKKSTWKEYPRNMLFARALSNGARWYCPAIFGGAVYTHEELGYAVDDEGRAVEPDAGGGSGSVNGSAHSVFGSAAKYVGVDHAPGDGVDLVVNAHDLDLPERFDVVLCCEMLEHDANPLRTIEVLRKHTATGGVLIVTTPGNGFPEHKFPRDYWRIMPDTLQDFLFCGMDVLELTTITGPTVCGAGRVPAE